MPDSVLTQTDPSPETAGTPPTQEELTRAPRSRFVQILQVIGLTALFAAAFVGYAWWQTGSFSHVGAYLQGVRVFFTPMQVEMNGVVGGTIMERSIRVTNLSSRPISLIGAEKSCSCIATSDFPVEIPSHDSREIRLRIGIPSTRGHFAQAITIFTSDLTSAGTLINIAGFVE